jgi:hypothetical protein
MAGRIGVAPGPDVTVAVTAQAGAAFCASISGGSCRCARADKAAARAGLCVRLISPNPDTEPIGPAGTWRFE